MDAVLIMRRLFASLLIWLAAAAPCFAAVALDTGCTERHSNPGVTTFSATAGDVVVSATSEVIVLTVVQVDGASAITGVTAHHDSLATNQAFTSTNSAANGNRTVWILGLRNPTVTATGILKVDWTNSGQVAVCATSFNGADLTSDATAFKNFNSANGSATSSQSVSITATSNDAVVAGFVGVGTTYSSVNQTSQFIDNSGNTYAAAGNRAVNVANPTMTANFSGTFTVVSAGIDVGAPGGGGATCQSRTLLGVGC